MSQRAEWTHVNCSTLHTYCVHTQKAQGQEKCDCSIPLPRQYVFIFSVLIERHLVAEMTYCENTRNPQIYVFKRFCTFHQKHICMLCHLYKTVWPQSPVHVMSVNTSVPCSGTKHKLNPLEKEVSGTFPQAGSNDVKATILKQESGPL